MTVSNVELQLFDAMHRGLTTNSKLVAVVLPRVSPEQLVVACAAEGLLAQLAGKGTVTIEKQKRDLVVESDGQSHWYEFKALWPNGVRECVNGLEGDLRGKLSGRHDFPSAFAVAFLYAVREAPGCDPARTSQQSLEGTLSEATKALGEPAWHSDVSRIDEHGVKAEIQLIAWRAPHGA